MNRNESKWYRDGYTVDWFDDLNQAQRLLFLESLTDAEALDFAQDWMVWAHDYQIPPETDWDTWLFLAGRGSGKTRSAVEYITYLVMKGKIRRIAIVGQGEADIRNVMVEGVSGFLNCAKDGWTPQWFPSAGGGRLLWPNGAQAFVYSAVDTESLRGPEFDFAWFDEPMAVPPVQRNRAMDNLDFCLRLGEHPQLILTTTPKKDPWLRAMLAMADDPEQKIHLSRATTYDNARNLAKNYIRKIKRKFGGTNTGRQEILGELLGDEEGALWTEEMVEKDRWPEKDPHRVKFLCNRIVVSVDPNTKDQGKTKRTAHAAGIVVVGAIGRERVVLADRSISGGPAKWAKAAVDAAIEFNAGEIHGESNQGGDMVQMVIAQEAKERGWKGHVHITFTVSGKKRRAEPVAMLYNKGLVHHVGPQVEMAVLETQMQSIHEKLDPTGEDFDRCDALCWGMYRLGLRKRVTTGSSAGAKLVGITTFGAFTNGPTQETGRSVPADAGAYAEL